MNLNCFSDRHCPRSSRNCERQSFVWRTSTHIVFVFNRSFCYRSTGLVAETGSFVGRVYDATGLLGEWMLWDFLLSLQTTDVCLVPPNWWHTRHLIDDEDQWYLVVETSSKTTGIQQLEQNFIQETRIFSNPSLSSSNVFEEERPPVTHHNRKRTPLQNYSESDMLFRSE